MSENAEGMATDNGEYSAASIKVLKGLEAVRRRAGMYVGDTEDGSGLRHMVYYWAGDFALEDAKANGASRVDVTLNANGSVTVEHDGAGLPVRPHRYGGTEAEAIMTQLSHGDIYFGLPVVNALSSRLDLTIWNDGIEYCLAYEKGEPLYPLNAVGSSLGKSGVRVTFTPCHEIFAVTALDCDRLEKRFRELAFLNGGQRITLSDQRGEQSKATVICYPDGLSDFVRHLDREHTAMMATPTELNGERGGITVHAALWWHTGDEENVVCYTNGIRQTLGGTHAKGVRKAVTQVFTKVSSLRLAYADACAGLTCVASVKADNPQFDATRKEVLSQEVGTAVQRVIADGLNEWRTKNAAEAERIAEKIACAANARKRRAAQV